MSRGLDARQLDRLELAALAYLLAPMALFLWGWWRWPVALLASALLAVMLHAVVAKRRPIAETLPARLWLPLAAVALIWVASSGLLGGLPLNADWGVRMHALRDLTVGAWPVGYGELMGGESILRFSMGYYLVPAGLGAALGSVDAARLLMGLWTVLGVVLFFALVLQNWPDRRPAVVALVLSLLTLFSGMDMLGFLLGRAYTPALGQHIEWWTPWLQYSSQTTLLFWVPNHALPAWLGAALVWRHRERGLALAPAALLLVAAALWSPLACVGLLPLLALATARGIPISKWMLGLCAPSVLAALPLLLMLAVFVTFGMDGRDTVPELPQGAQVAAPTVSWHAWLVFQLLEWGLLACALLSTGVRRQPWVFWAACAMLLLLPLLRFGPGNDLVMRGGVAPMTLLMLRTGQALTQGALAARWHRAALLMLLIGCITPAQELIRQSQPGDTYPDDGRTLTTFQGHAWHYVGRLSPGVLASCLKPPQPLLGRR